MSGVRDILPAMPPILLAGWSITNPTTALADCRIAESSDPTYGTIKWIPRLDDKPFAILSAAERRYTYPHPNNRNIAAQVEIFLAIGHAEAPTAIYDYNDRYNAWLDALEEGAIDLSRRLLSVAQATTSIFDMRWDLDGPTRPEPHRVVNGEPYYGALIMTTVRYIKHATYQP